MKIFTPAVLLSYGPAVHAALAGCIHPPSPLTDEHLYFAPLSKTLSKVAMYFKDGQDVADCSSYEAPYKRALAPQPQPYNNQHATTLFVSLFHLWGSMTS